LAPNNDDVHTSDHNDESKSNKDVPTIDDELNQQHVETCKNEDNLTDEKVSTSIREDKNGKVLLIHRMFASPHLLILRQN